MSLWILGFWIFTAVLIILFFGFQRWIAHPKFRGGEGDISTEVGYVEDAVGHDIEHPELDESQESLEEPHIAITTNPHTGPM